MINGYRQFRMSFRNDPETEGIDIIGARGMKWKNRDARAACQLSWTNSTSFNHVQFKHVQKRDFKRAHKHLINDGNLGIEVEGILNNYVQNDCSCGIYIARSVDELILQDYLRDPARCGFEFVAAMSGWGAYVEYENCYRVEFARIEHIFALEFRDEWRSIRFGSKSSLKSFAEQTYEPALRIVSEKLGVPVTRVPSWWELVRRINGQG